VGGQDSRDEAEGNGNGAVTTGPERGGNSNGEDDCEGGCEGERMVGRGEGEEGKDIIKKEPKTR
jgi:hypothetical protein